MKVIIAPDKFKGCLSALEVAHAIRDGIVSVLKDAEVVCCPIADGGEGTAEVLCRALQGGWQEVAVQDPLGRKIIARYCWSEKDRKAPVAVIEMSEASGMGRLTGGELDPMRSNTFGTGQLILAASRKGAEKIIVGLGGSATNDGGAGVAAALGYRFFDRGGRELKPLPCELWKIDRIERPVELKLPEVIAAVDVGNVLLGPEGATNVYGRQKGANERQLVELEKGLKNLADVAERDLGCHHRERKGAGAAGGLGFGLLCFCGAQVRSGFGLVAEALELGEMMKTATIVITAEGKMDSQTLQGKGPAGVAALARKCGLPVVALAGSVSDEEALNRLFDVVVPVLPAPMNLDVAMANAAAFLSQAAARVARTIQLAGRW